MGLMITCPNCGPRPYLEFWWGGELVDSRHDDPADTEQDFARVWLRDNIAGEQTERWFHFAGCRRWLTVLRDTRTNLVHGDA